MKLYSMAERGIFIGEISLHDCGKSLEYKGVFLTASPLDHHVPKDHIGRVVVQCQI